MQKNFPLPWGPRPQPPPPGYEYYAAVVDCQVMHYALADVDMVINGECGVAEPETAISFQKPGGQSRLCHVFQLGLDRN